MLLAVLETYDDVPSSNIIYTADYYALLASGGLEIFRAAVYNYLVFVLRMPVTSDIILRPGQFVDDLTALLLDIFTCIGSVIAYFGTTGASAGAAQNLASAVNSLTSNPTAVNGGTVRSVSVNGRVYYATNSPSSYNQVDNTSLIVGLVVGLVGATVLIVGSVIGYKQYQKRREGRRLVNDESELETSSVQHEPTRSEPPLRIPRTANSNANELINMQFLSPPSSVINANRFDTPLPTLPHEERVPSAAMSVTTLDVLTPYKPKPANKRMPAIELIKFD